jgi:DNA invertase Pin-like site-specific DNA recombinase
MGNLLQYSGETVDGFGSTQPLGKSTFSTPLRSVAKQLKLIVGILALIAEFENEIRRERQMDGIAKAKEREIKFGLCFTLDNGRKRARSKVR